MTSFDKAIWEALSKFRNRVEFSGFHHSTRVLEIIGSLLGSERLETILADDNLMINISKVYSVAPPPYVYRFINSLAEIIKPKNHLDPWITCESPSNYFNFGQTTAFCKNKSTYEICKSVFINSKDNIALSDGLFELDNVKESFDFITCFPPFNAKVQSPEVKGNNLPNDLAAMLLIKSSLLLNEGGKAVFLLPPSFLINKKNIEALMEAGLFLDAVFYLPSGALSGTAISSCLVVVSKHKIEQAFVAEISSDESSNKKILENYKRRCPGKLIQLGILINISELTTFKSIEAKNEIYELSKRTGYSPIPLHELTIKISLVNVSDIDEIDHAPNSIYFPKIGNSPIVTMPAEMTLKNIKNYYQIQFDQKKVNAIFVAKYFNSEFGKKVRVSLESGIGIRFISKSQLESCSLYLPALDDQVQIVGVNHKIEELNLRLGELMRNLWKRPKNYNLILKELKDINKADNLEHWIGNLPFPLSSILWHYYSTKDNRKKVEHLFHFFEALTEFLAMTMLSAVVQDDEFYKAERSNLIESDEKYKDWYTAATFGGWYILASRLSKLVRKNYNDPEKREFCLSLFGYPSESFMRMLTERGIIRTLEIVSKMRNNLKGHGGISSDSENVRVIALLEGQLNELRKFIADGFDDAKIISARKGELDEGVFTYEVRELVGAISPFKEAEIQSLLPLDKRKLYLLHVNQVRPIELLPFIRYEESSGAVYFYSSIESNNVRWVSYHFENEPILNKPADGELYRALDYLK